MSYLRTYILPPCNQREVLRYAQCPEPTEEMAGMLEEVFSEAAELELCTQVCYEMGELRLSDDGGTQEFCGIVSHSQALGRALNGCSRVLVFATTLGLAVDRLIQRYSMISPVKGLFFQAYGAERVEALCDVFCEDMSRELALEGLCLRPRFSPGYGDLPLEMQRDFFALLDCPRKLGLTLNTSLLMSPSKSVTAVAGIKLNP